jgi:hypothetical protein
MKKNILTVIILALTLMNVILSAVIVLVIVPTSNKTNQLITKVASVIDLEVSGSDGSGSDGKLDVENIDSSIKYSFDPVLTMNLKSSNDGKDHFAMMDSMTFSLDKTNKDYAKFKDTLTEKQDIITDMLRNAIKQCDINQINNNEGQIKEQVLKQLKQYYNSDFIIDISFGGLKYQ